MFKSQNKTSAEGLSSTPNMPSGDSSWKPSLRRMTKRMFSSSSKSPTRPSRPALPQGWMDENQVKPPSSHDPPRTTIPQHPRGPREPSQESFGFMKRSISKRDKELLSPRQRTHVSKPSIGASSCTLSAVSTEYTHISRDGRYPDTDAETSPSSTLPRDLPTPTGNRTSYASKRSGKDYTNSSILLPTVYQPPKNDATEVSLDSFPIPPFDAYHSNPNLNPRVASPISFLSPPRITHTAPEGKEGPQGLQRLSIAEHPETLALLSEPRDESEEVRKSAEQVNDDFQLFLAKSRTQAKNRNSMLSQHNFKPEPQPQDIYSTPRTSKILDELTLNHNIQKRLSHTPSLSKKSNPRPYPMQAAPEFKEQSDISLALHPAHRTFSPTPPQNPRPQPQTPPQTKEVRNSTNPIQQQPSTPLHESRFSVDSRPHYTSTTSSLYGKMREYIFPPRSRPNSTISNSLAINNLPSTENPRLYKDKDKSYGTLGNGTGRSSRWSRVGRSIKRSLSLDRDKEGERRVASGRMGGEFLNDREDLMGVDGGMGGRRASKIMPTSRGLDRYNRTVNGGYWK